MKQSILKICFYVLIFSVCRISSVQAASFETSSFAWSEEYGWINFNPPTGGTEVLDTKITGYAWSQLYGWINLQPTSTTGVTHNGDGVLTGYAWGENIGYINFSGVFIDQRTGIFSGTAAVVTGGSRIHFSCTTSASCAQANYGVTTAWRKADTTQTTQTTQGAIVAVGGASFNNNAVSPASPPPAASATPPVPSVPNLLTTPLTPTKIISPPPPRTPSCAKLLTKDLSRARHNPADTKKLQNFLRKNLPNSSLPSTGVFAEKTYREVIRFQKQFPKEIKTTRQTEGVVGPATREKINQLTCT